jgi:hypothetical protein
MSARQDVLGREGVGQRFLVRGRESLCPTAAAPIVTAAPDATQQEQHQEDHQD